MCGITAAKQALANAEHVYEQAETERKALWREYLRAADGQGYLDMLEAYAKYRAFSEEIVDEAFAKRSGAKVRLVWEELTESRRKQGIEGAVRVCF